MPGLYFEQFQVGQTFEHAIRRTVTESDNVFFTALDDYLGFKLARENAQLADATMYSTDYQHSITLWPDSQTFIPKLTDGMEQALKHKLLAGNAVRVFNLE